MQDKLKYSYSLILYFQWKWANHFGMIICRILALIPKYLFLKGYNKRLLAKFDVRQREAIKIMQDPKDGLRIYSSKRLVNLFVWIYVMIIPICIMIPICVLWGISKSGMNIVIMVYCIIGGLLEERAKRLYFPDDGYLLYFKIFEKKDKKWHRKWCWINVVFIIGGFGMIFMGLGVAILTFKLLM